jgi:hypothetical protein
MRTFGDGDKEKIIALLCHSPYPPPPYPTLKFVDTQIKKEKLKKHKSG